MRFNRYADLREIVIRSYGKHTPSPGELDYIERHLSRYAATIGFLPRNPGKLLDVGSFPGHTSVLAAHQGWAVTGISKLDEVFVGRSFVDRMRESNIAIHDVDVEKDVIPEDDGVFDCVFFNEIVEHLPYNPFHALDQAWRVLKSGGRMVFSVPNLASFDHIWALLRGRSFYPEVTRPLEDAYHADIGQRHIREYTVRECKYLLTQQDKYLYRFVVDKVVMDRSWDGLFFTEHGYQRRLGHVKPGRLLRSLLTKICGRYRSNIIILAHKPENYFMTSGAPLEDGFYPAELSGASASFVRTPLESRWMKPKAAVAVDIPASLSHVQQVDLLMWMPAPACAGMLRIESRINGVQCEPLETAPSAEPVRRTLVPSHPVPCRGDRRQLVISLQSTEWSPKSLGISEDDRSLGPMLYLKKMGITAQQ